MQLDKAIQGRKSVRKFSSKKPDWRDIIECIDAGRYAPMAGNLFSVKFILVDNQETIQKLTQASQQDFFANAQYLVAVYSNPSKTKNAYEERADKFLRQQAGAAIQNFLLKIEEKKLATCWVGHFVDEQVQEILSIPGDMQIEAIFPIGYEYKETKQKRKTDLDQILYFNKHGNKKMKPVKQVKEFA